MSYFLVYINYHSSMSLKSLTAVRTWEIVFWAIQILDKLFRFELQHWHWHIELMLKRATGCIHQPEKSYIFSNNFSKGSHYFL
mmetsp:Transcript_16583/g.31417  ORF Transcript_16583/g.31417 Transcript_16583/m.31417 type:complete len:83 (-) Transcript_16583:475-723(-)